MHFRDYLPFIFVLSAPVIGQIPQNSGSTVGNWAYVGCFADTPNKNYILPTFYNGASVNTVEWCIANCISLPSYYAAVENSAQCFCGDTLNTYNYLVADSYCTSGCDNNATERCGANGYSSLYYSKQYANALSSSSIAASRSSWSSVLSASRASFYSSKSSAASLVSVSKASASASRVSARSSVSSQRSARISSISAAGASRSSATSAKSSSRSAALASKSSSQLSRSSSRASASSSRSAAAATKSVAVRPYRYSACYPLDPNNPPLLLHPSIKGGGNDLEVCANSCFNHTNFGVANNQCYCGNTIAATATTVAAQSCFSNALTCSGNAAELCGQTSFMPIFGQVTAIGTCPSGTSVWSTVGCSTISAHRSGATLGNAKRDPNGIEAFMEREFLVEEYFEA